MRGFLSGSLALIVLYVALQPGSAEKAAQGSGLFVRGLRRAMSPDVAGVPQRSGRGVGSAVGEAAAAGAVGGAEVIAGQQVPGPRPGPPQRRQTR